LDLDKLRSVLKLSDRDRRQKSASARGDGAGQICLSRSRSARSDSRKHVLRGQIGRKASGIYNSLCRHCWLAPGTGATSQIGQSVPLRFKGSLSNTSGANLLSVSAVMCNVVASGAKRDQVLFGIVAGVAAKLFVVDFQVRHRAACLASRTVEAQISLAEFLYELHPATNVCVVGQSS